MSDIDHPLRFSLTEELHARPSPRLTVPCHAVMVAFKEPRDAANRDRGADLAHLADLLARHGAPPPSPGATHVTAQIGAYRLRWESYTEFVTYTAFADGLGVTAFDPNEAAVFPDDWIAAAPGKRIASVLVRVEPMPDNDATIDARLSDWFNGEGLAAGRVNDDSAVVATDFRIDAAGHMRFAVFVRPGTGPGRVGRIVQRLLEIETYRVLSMLGLGRARGLSARLNALDPQVAQLIGRMDDESNPPEATLHALLATTTELESLAMEHSFRFGATPAYAAIVRERIDGLREARFAGRQTLNEFMQRRYEPAMRTVASAEGRLATMLTRSTRAGDLLRTRVDVERSRQNQALLESMDRRADLQLRLQETVEGLSVVAISYYAVSLAGYILYPLAEPLGLSKGLLLAMVTPLVILGVWLMVRRIKHKIH